MKRKMIFFDIDGTLVGEEFKTISDSTKRAIALAQKNGHLCIVNTGRTQKLVGEDFTSQCSFDGYVMGCGTRILYHDQVLLQKTIESELAHRIVEGLKRHRIDAILEGTQNDYHDEMEQIHTKVFYDFVEHFAEKKYQLWAESYGKFDKFYAYVEETERMQAFAEEFKEELEFIDREKGFYEIVPRGYSKASGIRFLAGKLEIPMEDTVAIGDSNNDITMLECAGTSIAMGNSTQAVLEMADHVTTHVDQDGIWNALEWLGVL